jgi:hypothetical protein
VSHIEKCVTNVSQMCHKSWNLWQNGSHKQKCVIVVSQIPIFVSKCPAGVSYFGDTNFNVSHIEKCVTVVSQIPIFVSKCTSGIHTTFLCKHLALHLKFTGIYFGDKMCRGSQSRIVVFSKFIDFYPLLLSFIQSMVLFVINHSYLYTVPIITDHFWCSFMARNFSRENKKKLFSAGLVR